MLNVCKFCCLAQKNIVINDSTTMEELDTSLATVRDILSKSLSEVESVHNELQKKLGVDIDFDALRIRLKL